MIVATSKCTWPRQQSLLFTTLLGTTCNYAPAPKTAGQDRLGTLAWHRLSSDLEFGKIRDDETGQIFHVEKGLLDRAGLTASNDGAKVTFAANAVAAAGKTDPLVYRIKRAPMD